MEAGGLTWEGSVCISMMVLCLVMALVGIMLAPSHRTKAVSCAACGKRQRIPSGTPPLAEGVSTTSLATHRAEGASREQPDEVPPVAATPSPPAKTTEPGHQCAECGRPVVLYEQTLTDLAGMGVTKQRVGLEVERHRLVAVGSAHDIYWFLSQHSPSEAEVFREVWAGHAYACPQCRRLLCAECAGAMPGDDPEWVPVGTGRCPRCGTPFEGTTLTEWPEWAE